LFSSSIFFVPFVIAIIIAIIIESSSLVPTAYAVQSGGYQTYENAEYGLRIQYPSDWEKVDNGILGGYFYNTSNAVVEFLPSNASLYFRQDDQSTHESLALVVANYKNSSRDIDRQLSDFGNQRKSFVNATCPDFRILYENTNATLSHDSPAHEMAYKYTHDGIMYMATEIWTVKDGKSYLLAFGGHETSYKELLPEVESVFESFKLIT
jgi:hypothetical protein